jgi:hypothetical protein
VCRCGGLGASVACVKGIHGSIFWGSEKAEYSKSGAQWQPAEKCMREEQWGGRGGVRQLCQTERV